MTRKKKKIDIKLIIGILFLLVLLIGASYAYFAVGIESSEYNKTIVTGSTEGTSIASIQNPTEKLNLNVDAAAMSQNRLGTIYADDEENYVKTKSEGFHDIGVITLTNSQKDDNIYRCTANVTISIDNGVNSILPVLEKDDLKVFLRWGTNHQVIDLSTIKETGEITIPISLDIIGNNSKSIETYIEFTNRDEDQSYLSLKDINIDIDTTDLKCELTGERAVYLKSTGFNDQNSDFRSEEWRQYIKNIYFVDYINTDSAIETWDLTNVGTGKNQSLAGSIIGWLEEIPKGTEEEETQFYNLYIGSKDRIYSLNISYSFFLLSNLEKIVFGNFYNDLNGSMQRCCAGDPNIKEMDVSSWNTTNMNFQESFNLPNLQELNVSNFNTKNVTIMSSMFGSLSKVSVLDTSNFNTSKVWTMANMFSEMKSLAELDVSSFYTGNVINMSGMFSGMSLLQKLDLSKFVTNKVEDMSSMFSGLSSIQELDLSNFNTGNVSNMSSMFMNASSLKELNLSKFNTSNVTSMEGMFKGLSSLQKLDLSNFDVSKVTTMSTMFYNMSSLQELDLSNFNTKKVVVMNSMFRDMKSLEYLDLRNAEFKQVESYDNMFSGVKNGITIIVKDEANREWIEERLKETSRNGNVLLPSEIDEKQ